MDVTGPGSGRNVFNANDEFKVEGLFFTLLEFSLKDAQVLPKGKESSDLKEKFAFL